MNATDLREQIEVQRRVDKGTDESGNPIHDWEPFFRAYAAVRDVSGREFFAAAAEQLQNTVTFTIRHHDGVMNDMRVLYNDVPYDIVHINHLGYRRDYLTIRAEIVDGEGSNRGSV